MVSIESAPKWWYRSLNSDKVNSDKVEASKPSENPARASGKPISGEAAALTSVLE
jgi:hypothetical protein